MASTTRPSARSLSAIMARGVGAPGRRALRVIVAEVQDRELRQVAVLHEPVELLQPGVDALADR